jgi:hypothetical protein
MPKTRTRDDDWANWSWQELSAQSAYQDYHEREAAISITGRIERSDP